MDTQTQIDRLIELAIIQRSELKQLVEQLPQLREHLNAEVEKVFDETEPQLRAELEEWTTKQTADKTAALGVALEAKIADLAKSLEVSTQARYNAIIAEREENARLAAEAEAKIAEHAASLPGAVKEIVSAELARFPRAGEIDQLRKEFAEPRGLNPRGKWQAGETYNKLDLVTINGDSYTSNTDGNRTRPSRSSADWTLVAARGTGGGGGPTSLSELTTVPSDGDLLVGSGTSWVTSNLTAGAGISITVGPGAITISATDGDITLDDGTAASPSLHFTNDPDTGIYRPAANTLGISVSGTQVAYFDENGLTVPSAGVVAGGSFHGANGNANNPSFSFTSDQDTGFYRHGTNELGISIGGTEKAVMTSTTFSITPNVSTSGNLTVSGTASVTGQINGSAGYQFRAASGTTYELLRYVGGTNNPGIFATVNESTKKVTIFASGSLVSGQTLGLGAEGSEALTLGAANATLAGNLTVSGGALTLNNATESYVELKIAGTAKGYLDQLPTTLNVVGMSGVDVDVYAGGNNPANRVAKFASGNATTLYGNLTVSGTGTSSVAGSLRVSAATAISKLTVGDASNTFSAFIFGNNSANGIAFGTGGTGVPVINGYNNTFAATQTIAVQPNGGNLLLGTTSDAANARLNVLGANNAGLRIDQGSYNYHAAFEHIFSSLSYTTEYARIKSNGNVLLGTTTDSSNGRLQLATHTTSAGGIGFGTDVSLYRVAAGNLTLSTSTAGAGFSVTNSTNGGQITAQSAGTPMFVLSDTTQALNEKIWGIRSSSASFVIGAWTDSYSAISNAIKIDRSAGTPSLVTITPDATFAGTIVAVGNSTFKRSDNTGSIRIIPTSGVSAGSDIESFNPSTSAYGRLNTRGTHLQVYTGTSANTLALTVDDSQNATFAQGIVVQNSDCTLYRSTTATLTINNNFNISGLLRTGSSTPANASGAGVAGTITWDASYIYVCTAANTWKRVAIATW